MVDPEKKEEKDTQETAEQKDVSDQLKKIAEEANLPPEKEKTAESLEDNFKEMHEIIENKLGEDRIWIGGTEDGGEIYWSADNLKEILGEVDKTTQQAILEKWDKEKFLKQLSGITVKIDTKRAQESVEGGVLPSYIKPESKLGDFDWFG